MRWKNGGGETLEIAVSPPGATLDALDWRVSAAIVENDCPFSVFPGVDRTLCILDGEGLALSVDAQPTEVVLTAGSDPFRFAADRPAMARPVRGSTTDFNVMTRRSRYRHDVRRLYVAGRRSCASVADELLLFCRGPDLCCRVAGQPDTWLSDRDAAVLRGTPGLLRLEAPAATTVFVVEFYRAPATSA